MRYRLIALDLDGTLLSSKKEISPRAREALRAARERGIATVIATGRTPHSALHFGCQIEADPVICCNGAGIMDPSGSFLVARGIPREPLKKILQLSLAAGLLTECYTPDGIVQDQPLRLAQTYLGWMRPQLSTGQSLQSLLRFWRLNRIRTVADLRKWAEQPKLPSILKCMVIGEPTLITRFIAHAAAAIPGLEMASSAPDNVEITGPGVSKGSSLQLLSARLQIPPEAIMAFGDAENDLSMLKYAGMGVAMGNATAEVKAVARHVTATCDEDGVARTVEELCLQ